VSSRKTSLRLLMVLAVVFAAYLFLVRVEFGDPFPLPAYMKQDFIRIYSSRSMLNFNGRNHHFLSSGRSQAKENRSRHQDARHAPKATEEGGTSGEIEPEPAHEGHFPHPCHAGEAMDGRAAPIPDEPLVLGEVARVPESDESVVWKTRPEVQV